MTCTAIDDNAFGPQVDDCIRVFDFTLLFEDTILSILPVVASLLYAFAVAFSLRDTKAKVNGGKLRALKLTALLIYSALQLGIVVVWSIPPTFSTKATTASVALGLANALTLSLLSVLEHTRSLRPSTVLCAYFSTSLLLDIARTRTLWLIPANHTVAILFTVATLWKVPILLLETRSKRASFKNEFADCATEDATGIVGRAFLWWMNPLFARGLRKRLSMKDLFLISDDLGSDLLLDKSDTVGESTVDNPSRILLAALIWDLRWPFMAVIPTKIAVVAFQLAQPFLVSSTLEWFATSQVTGNWNNKGYGLIGAYFFIYTGLAMTTALSQRLVNRLIAMTRGILVSRIYERTLQLSVTSVGGSAPLTLMSTDVELVCNGIKYFHEVWSSLIQVAVGMWLLERQLGIGAVAPIGISILCVVGTSLLGGTIAASQGAWVGSIQERVGVTASVLGSMKSLRLGGLSDVLSKLIQDLRVKELNVSKLFRRLLIVNVALSYTSGTISPVIGFAIYIAVALKSGGTLQTSQAFASLTLFSLVSTPFDIVIQTLPALLSAVACCSRMQNFLSSEPRKDFRIKPKASISDESPSSEGADPSSLKTEKHEVSTTVTDLGANIEIVVRNGTFRWKTDAEPILKNLNLSIYRSELTVIIGPVSCGKTSLLHVFLGEIEPVEGSVIYGSANAAYCSQSPWLQNKTIQDNILGENVFDMDWYCKVVHACVLTKTFSNLQLGDQTVVGSQGLSLSGGEKQRIALARAVYARTATVILDDVLSGLDPVTESLLFKRLFGINGLFSKLGTTVVLATHSVRHISAAHQVIALGPDGTLRETGDYEKMTSLAIVSKTTNEAQESAVDSTEDDLQDVPSSIFPSTPKTEPQHDAEEGDQEKRVGETAIYAYYFGSLGFMNCVLLIVSMSLFVFLLLFPSVWVGWWADANQAHPNQNIGKWLGVYAFFGIAAPMVLVVALHLMMVTMTKRSAERLHWIILDTVMNAPMSFFTKVDVGVTTNRFSQDMMLVDMELPLTSLNSLATLLSCLGQLIILSVTTRYLSVAFPFCVGILYLLQKFYVRTSSQLRILDLESKSPLYSQFIETLGGAVTIRAFGWQGPSQAKNNQLLDESQKPYYLLLSAQTWLGLVLNMFVACLAVLVMGISIVLRNVIDAGTLGVALVNIVTFGTSLKALLTNWTGLETSLGAVSRTKTFAETTPSENRHEDLKIADLPVEWPTSGSIEISSLSASHGPEAGLALQDVKMRIAAGEKIGVCGSSGSGKSSLVLSLFRMMDSAKGSIVVDGKDVSTIAPNELRSRLVAVPQEPFLFPGSVRMNLDPFSAATDEAIEDILRKTQLWDVVLEKGGLDTLVHTLELSQGRQQLLCIARAFLRKGKIVVLDEATSSIDGETEKVISALVRSELTQSTVIAIAHRLDTILGFDKVAVLNKGRLVEFDAPQALLSRESAFKELYDSTRN